MDEILIENIKLDQKGLVELLYEANSTVDIASYKMLMSKLIKRNSKTTCIDEITNVVPVNYSEGKIPTIGIKYDADDAIDSTNLKVFYSETDLGIVTDVITGSVSGATATIKYVEQDEDVYKYLVEVTTGIFTDLDVEITDRFSVIVGASNVFSNFSGAFGESEVDVDVAEFSKETASEYKVVVGATDFKCITKQAKDTNVTSEFIQDLKSVFKARGVETIISMLNTAINKEIEQTAFKYMKSIADVRGDIALSIDPNANGSLRDNFYVLYSRVNSSIGRIGTATNLTKGFFVVASSNVVAGLKTIKTVRPYTKKDSSNVAGYLPNGALLIEDGYSTRDYILVGTKGIDEEQNGGIIYTPYTFDLITAKDDKTMQDKLVPMHRFDLVRNNLDTKIDDGGSDFFEVTSVDFDTLDI